MREAFGTIAPTVRATEEDDRPRHELPGRPSASTIRELTAKRVAARGAFTSALAATSWRAAAQAGGGGRRPRLRARRRLR
jgi:hypothetical protein